MSIALVCNMNNNNFALMRYLRDLGALDYRNSQYDLVLKTGRSIGKHFKGFDAFIGSGLAPALLAKAGRYLDIFYPYGAGIEFVGEHWITETIKSGSLKRRLFYRYVQKKQITAIARTRFCVSPTIDGYTEHVFQSLIGRSFQCLAIPMVYNREEIEPDALPSHLVHLRDRFKAHTVVVLSHARHWWHLTEFQNYPTSFQELHNKHNDWLIQGFAKFIAQHPDENPLLVLFEYGPHVLESKQLIASLGIDHNVLWLPKSSRKEIMYLLSLSDIGVGEFPDSGMWGGTAWETLAAGKPLLQSVNYTSTQFRELFGYDLPPVLDVKSLEDVEYHLSEYVQNRTRFAAIGVQSREWFDENNGITLAARYLELLRS
jgi:hypothetical protein